MLAGNQKVRFSCAGSGRGAPSDDELIELTYAALLGESSWQAFLDRLTDVLPGGRSTLFFHDAGRGSGRFSLVSGFDARAVERYDRHFSAVNPFMPKAAVRPVGLGVVAEQMYPRSDLTRTEFYTDFMRPLGCESAIGVTIAREQGHSFMLSVMGARKDPDANVIEAKRLQRIAPHLRRAFNHYRKGPRLKAANEIVGSVLETLGIGVLVLGANAQLRSVSPRAQQMIETGVGLRIAPGGRVCVSCQRTAELLDAMTEPGPAPRVADTVISGRKPHSTVSVTLIRVGKDRFSAYFEGPTVIMLIEPLYAGERDRGGLESLSSHFRLTPAERRVLGNVVAGLSVREIADAAEVSRETVRTHLKRIYSKVGVGRQADLVRLAGKLRSKAGTRH